MLPESSPALRNLGTESPVLLFILSEPAEIFMLRLTSCAWACQDAAPVRSGLRLLVYAIDKRSK